MSSKKILLINFIIFFIILIFLETAIFFYRTINEKTNLGYIKTGELFKKIAEIGTGYGGQFLILDQFLDFSNYYFFDLKEVLLFCEKYLDNYLIRNSFKTLHINNYNGEEKFDLVISNYAFSELPSELQRIYLRKVIKLSKRGYLTMNSGKKNSIFQGDYLSLDQIKKEIPFIKINNETPKDFVHQGNYVISWEK